MLAWYDGNAERARSLWREVNSPLGDALAANSGAETEVGMESGGVPSHPAQLLLSAWRPPASTDGKAP